MFRQRILQLNQTLPMPNQIRVKIAVAQEVRCEVYHDRTQVCPITSHMKGRKIIEPLTADLGVPVPTFRILARMGSVS